LLDLKLVDPVDLRWCVRPLVH